MCVNPHARVCVGLSTSDQATLAKFSIITRDDAAIAAHTVYGAVQIGGSLTDLYPFQSKVSRRSWHHDAHSAPPTASHSLPQPPQPPTAAHSRPQPPTAALQPPTAPKRPS